jgi:hypothetical protein
MANLKNVTIDSLEVLNLPSGTTAQRPSSPSAGMLRFNTDIQTSEYYDGSSWISDKGTISVSTTGNVKTIDFGQYRIQAFLGSGSFNVSRSGLIDVLLVGGGGGGGCHVPGGGGAGGLIYRPQLLVTPQNYTITIGSGGAGSFNPGSYTGMPNATAGGNTTAFGLTALGGGFGGSWTQDTRSNNGGSGGGRNTDRNGGQRLGLQPIQSGDSGTFGFGNNGGLSLTQATSNYPGSGGGGAGTPGQNAPASNGTPGNGGSGRYYGNIFTTNFGENGWFSGGGGGGAWGSMTDGRIGFGGIGGGGDGDTPSSGGSGESIRFINLEPRGDNGLPNTGGGGGGAGRTGGQSSRGGNGGSGNVIIRYIR